MPIDKLEATMPKLEEAAGLLMGLVTMLREMDPESDVDLSEIRSGVEVIAATLQSAASDLSGSSDEDDPQDEVEQSVNKAGAKMARNRREQFKQALSMLHVIASELGIDLGDGVEKSAQPESVSWPLDLNVR